MVLEVFLEVLKGHLEVLEDHLQGESHLEVPVMVTLGVHLEVLVLSGLEIHSEGLEIPLEVLSEVLVVHLVAPQVVPGTSIPAGHQEVV